MKGERIVLVVGTVLAEWVTWRTDDCRPIKRSSVVANKFLHLQIT